MRLFGKNKEEHEKEKYQLFVQERIKHADRILHILIQQGKDSKVRILALRILEGDDELDELDYYLIDHNYFRLIKEREVELHNYNKDDFYTDLRFYHLQSKNKKHPISDEEVCKLFKWCLKTDDLWGLGKYFRQEFNEDFNYLSHISNLNVNLSYFKDLAKTTEQGILTWYCLKRFIEVSDRNLCLTALYECLNDNFPLIICICNEMNANKDLAEILSSNGNYLRAGEIFLIGRHYGLAGEEYLKANESESAIECFKKARMMNRIKEVENELKGIATQKPSIPDIEEEYVLSKLTKAEYEKLKAVKPTSSEIITCPYCGKQIQTDFIFCPKCGKKV